MPNFKDTSDGKTYHCNHTTDNTICAECLGISRPKGVSEWLALGVKYGYVDYWKDKIYEDMIVAIAINSVMSVEETRKMIDFVKNKAK